MSLRDEIAEALFADGAGVMSPDEAYELAEAVLVVLRRRALPSPVRTGSDAADCTICEDADCDGMLDNSH